MRKFTDNLSRVRVAAPCPADWNEMIGDERKRFCGECSMNVYNLSDMSRREAEALIFKAEGRLCVRFYRRADGTILTRDCPKGGLQAIKRRASALARATLSSVLSFIAGVGLSNGLLKTGTVEPPLSVRVTPTVPLVNYSERSPQAERVQVEVTAGMMTLDAPPPRRYRLKLKNHFAKKTSEGLPDY